MTPALSHVESWIFDLDNTLYSPGVRLFDQIDERMGSFISRLLDVDRVEARRIQKKYFHEHGTTLSGLMASHGVEPDEFLDYVHDIDLAILEQDRALAEAIGELPGKKFVFTNGDAAYATRVLERLGLGASFDALHDIHAAGYAPKPDPASYDAMCAALDIAPERALFVEDMARNLRPAKALGMVTVWVNNGSERGAHEADAGYIDYEIEAVAPWLASLKETA
ncbi:MAG: pyrimidine 5'-nucleotidase [Parasphingopyxis sp.]